MANNDTRGKLNACPKCGMIFESAEILRTHNLWVCTGPAMVETSGIDTTLAASAVGTPAAGEVASHRPGLQVLGRGKVQRHEGERGEGTKT